MACLPSFLALERRMTQIVERRRRLANVARSVLMFRTSVMYLSRPALIAESYENDPPDRVYVILRRWISCRDAEFASDDLSSRRRPIWGRRILAPAQIADRRTLYRA